MKAPTWLPLLVFLFIGCGQDGEDGDAYLSFSWDWYIDSYTDNNPNVPSIINEYQDYIVRPGTYSFEYNCSDGMGNYWGYDGWYAIEINRGEQADFMTDGADGEDNHYRLDLTGNGVDFYLRRQNQVKVKLLSLNSAHAPDADMYNKEYVGGIEEYISYSNSGRMIVTRRLFILVQK